MPRKRKTSRRKRKIQRGGSLNSSEIGHSIENNQPSMIPTKSKTGGRDKAIKNIKKLTSKTSQFVSSLGFDGMLLYCTFTTAVIMFLISIIAGDEKPTKKSFPTLLISYSILLLCSVLCFGIYGRKIMKNAGQNAIFTFFKIAIPALSAIASLSYIIFLNAKWKVQLAHVTNYMPEMNSFNILIACISIMQVYKVIEYFRTKSKITGDFSIGSFNTAVFALLFLTSFGLTTVIFTKIQAYITDG